MGYILVIFSSLLTSLVFAAGKSYQLREGTDAQAGFKFTAMTGLCTAIIFLCLNKFHIEFAPYSVIMSSLQALLTTSYTILGMNLMKMGTLAIYTIFLMTGGMIVPYFAGILFLDEPSTIMKTIGLIVIIAGVVLTKFSKEKISAKQLSLCIIVFFLNGGVSVVSKFHQVEEVYKTVESIEFTILSSVARFILSGLALVFLKNHASQKNVAKKGESKKSWMHLCIISALMTGFSSILQLNGASDIPATVLYPIITGGAIIFTSLSGTVFFGEKLSKNVLASISLCTFGLVLFCM